VRACGRRAGRAAAAPVCHAEGADHAVLLGRRVESRDGRGPGAGDRHRHLLCVRGRRGRPVVAALRRPGARDAGHRLMTRAALFVVGVAGSTAPAAPPRVPWAPVGAGVERASFPLARKGVLASVQVIAVRVVPCRVALEFVERTRYEGLRGAWTVDSMGSDAILALNGGQFREGTPWGWIVRDGVEQQPPGTGALAMALVVDNGAVRLLRPDEIAAARGTVQHAIQSYPALVVDGVMPTQLRTAGQG